MKSWIWQAGLFVVAMATGGMFLQKLHRENGRLRQRVAELHTRNEKAAQSHDDNERVQALLAGVERDGSGADDALRGELEKVRTEVAKLEEKDRERQRQRGTVAATLVQNRNPDTGPVRLEHFANVGRATPGAALQTLLWAVTKGEDGTVAEMLAIDPAVKQILEGWRAQLPPETRAKYPTAESLAALHLANTLLGHESARFEEQRLLDAQHATVSVAFRRDQPARPMEMQLGPGGWQLSITAKMAAEMPRRQAGPSNRQ